MESKDAAHRVGELYRAIYDRFHRRVRPEVYSPSPESLGVLEHLSRVGPLTVMEAARHFDRAQSAMSEIFGRLERRALVARMPDERDRRRSLVWLTEEGRAVLRRARQVLSERLLHEALRQIEPGERVRIVEALEALLETAPSPEGYDDE